MKTAILCVAVIVLFSGCANADVVRRRDILQDVPTTLKQAVANQDPSQVEKVAAALPAQQQAATNQLASDIQAGSSQAEKVPTVLEKVPNLPVQNGDLASQLPTTAQQLQQTTGLTQTQLQDLAKNVAGGAANPPAAEKPIQDLLKTVQGQGGRRLQQDQAAAAAPAAEGPNPILQLYRKALTTAICANPSSAAGALGAGIVSNNNNVALATLQGLADASSQCCDKAAQAADAGYKIAQQNGKGDIYIFRLLFAIFKIGLQFCALPPSFFARR